jgi:hypothetical protein
MRKVSSLVAFFFALAVGAQAQFIGYVSPQTVQQTLATSLACTGSQQTFSVSNLGQTQHYLSIIAASVQTFTAEIDGVDTQGNVYRISDVLELAGASAFRQGTVVGSGYFPKIQVSVLCGPTSGSFTASYSGGSSISNVPVGTLLTAAIDKINFFSASATTNQQDNNEQTPYGSSAGTLLFAYAAAPSSTGAVSILCSGVGISSAVTVFTASLANTTAVQVFSVPDKPCPFASVQYGAGTGGTTVSAEYLFSSPGRSTPTNLYKNITSNASTQVKTGSGFLHSITTNNAGSTETLTVYDNSSCTAPAIATTGTVTAGTLTYDVQFFTGLCITSTGTTAGNFTVSYQ